MKVPAFKLHLFATIWILSIGPADIAYAETDTVRIAKQFGIAYLPLTLMEEERLLELKAKEQGIETKVEWVRLPAGAPMNDAIVSGNLDFASGGVGPLLVIWSKTRTTNVAVKGVAALNAMPLYLVTTNPDVRTIKDFTDRDKIALPGVKTSIQAVTLQMASEEIFGKGQQDKLDLLTVSMGHSDAMIALLDGNAGINSHFGAAPFQDIELANRRVHKVLDSYEVLGGPHTFTAVWASSKFASANPKIMKAFLNALQASMDRIKSAPAAAAAIWIKAEDPKLSLAEAERIIRNPQNEWTTTPKKVMTYLEYLNRAGVVTTKTSDWKDIFFDGIHSASGN